MKLKTIAVTQPQIVIVIGLQIFILDPDPIFSGSKNCPKAYPGRDGDERLKTREQLNPNEQDFTMINDIRRRFTATELKFVPLPASYLRGARWDNEIVADKPKVETPIDIAKRLIREAEGKDDAKESKLSTWWRCWWPLIRRGNQQRKHNDSTQDFLNRLTTTPHARC